VIIGLANGCYDLLHEGHRHFLRKCSSNCQYLIVAVNTDDWCFEHKGPGRPNQSLDVRMEDLATFLHFLPNSKHYGYAVIPFAGDSYRLIEAIRPNIVFRGHDQRDECPYTIPVFRIDKVEGFSTTLQAQRRDP
jgi:D-beta-D-heptose 7-phosphate kinase / D-beta-D-heptose 1-phosphate adenosyltransferase